MPRLLLACFLLLSLAHCRPPPPSTLPPSEPPASPPQITQIPRLRELDFTPFTSALRSVSQEQISNIQNRLQQATLLDLQQAMNQGSLSAELLTLFFLHQIQRHDTSLRSYLELNPLCLQEARAADELRRLGQVAGPLHGIPISIKDNIDTTRPLHTTLGTELLLQHSPTEDASLVKQLRAAKAVILGKTSLSELAGFLTSDRPGFNAVSGSATNPYHPSFPTSGSSSGSAIATSALLTTLSIGTETSGSLIAPASKNGVVALKPSFGLVSNQGIAPLIRFQDCAGPITRSVTDAALLLNAIANSDTDFTSALRPDALTGVRVGLLKIPATDSPDTWLPAITAGLNQAKAILHPIDQAIDLEPSLLPVLSLGLQFDTIPYLQAAAAPVHSVPELREANLALPSRRIPRGQNLVDLAAEILHLITQDTQLPLTELGPIYQQTAQDIKAAATAVLDQTFRTHDVELLVSLGNTHSTLYATAGFPAITIPLGLAPNNGQPEGITFIARFGEDARLLALAYAFEQATRLRRPPPCALPSN